ncbi:tripartite tricarboxylate transporter substrate binding protein [Paracraurococcus lichenis]|uniref:Tripartite tricarboxylate transporter substrate binding protein n=1 Tax=Paracraurococcus lichenis TaxID=3064888 RepID=A0ABT9DXU3_9PROT|nr:tripartite tricarboxylate transporter substrate binding protein [Paracraurococcus sp. LOR1-02]MDO9708722.1 tripartite tricarboxylate transporter substrate binding protein [Paracraurococcus sp. LOR1-02]
MHRRTLLAAALAAPAIAPRGALAQKAWPTDRPVEVIVPFPPGGGVDIMTRLVMPLVAARIPGMTAVVTNRPGAGSQVGLEATFNAAPDGYTLGATSTPAHSAIPIERSARYRALDFTFLANIVEDPNCLYVRAESPIGSLADLVAQAKAKPGGLDYGTTGIGSDDHIMMLAFEALAGLPSLTHVPFAGVAPLIPQLLGGHLDMGVGNTTELAPLAREGKMRGLAVASAQRVPELPEVPTFRELGYDIVAAAARGIIAPPGLPQAVTAQLEEAFRSALADPGFVRDAARQAMPLRPLVGAEYKAMATVIDTQLHALWKLRPWKG